MEVKLLLVRLLFEDNKCIGYLAYMKEVYPYEDRENITMIKSNKDELVELVGDNWKGEFVNLILVDGEIKVGVDDAE